jgi:hypothetical protein
MIPDICGSLEDPGPGKTRERYERWFKQWAEPKFGQGRLHAIECFRLRCSMIHSGSAEIERPGILDRFVFFDDTAPGAHLGRQQFNLVNNAPAPAFIVLVVSQFCETIYQAAEAWDRSVTYNAAVQAEKAKLLVICSVISGQRA